MGLIKLIYFRTLDGTISPVPRFLRAHVLVNANK